MAYGGNGQNITCNEIKKNFIIDEPYGTIGAYPSKVIIVSDVVYGFVQADSQSRRYVLRNSYEKHAEGYLIQQIRDDIQEMENGGRELVTKVVLRLIQNYSPCDDYKNGDNGEKRGCASDIIEFKQELEESEKIVNITITFSNFFRWVGNRGHGPHSMAGLRKLLDNGVKVKPLQGKKNWKKFFDHNLVDLNDNERQELLDRAGSDDRGDKEKEDMKLWEKHVLQTLEAVGDLQQALENLFLQDN